MNLILLDSDEEPKFINVDNITEVHYNKYNKILTIYYIGDFSDNYQDVEAEVIYDFLKGEAKSL